MGIEVFNSGEFKDLFLANVFDVRKDQRDSQRFNIFNEFVKA